MHDRHVIIITIIYYTTAVHAVVLDIKQTSDKVAHKRLVDKTKNLPDVDSTLAL